MSKREKCTAYAEEIDKLIMDAVETQEGTAALMMVLSKALACIIMNVQIEEDKNVRKTLIKHTQETIRDYVKMMEVHEKEHTTFEA